MRNFKAPAATKIKRESADKPGEAIPLEAVQIGDAVEVDSADGKTALTIRVRAAR